MATNHMQKLLWSNELLDGFSKNPVVSKKQRVRGHFLKDFVFHYTKAHTPLNKRRNLLKYWWFSLDVCFPDLE